MARYLRGTATAALRVTGMALAVVLTTTAATGWLYWIRAPVAGWPGSAGRCSAATHDGAA